MDKDGNSVWSGITLVSSKCQKSLKGTCIYSFKQDFIYNFDPEYRGWQELVELHIEPVKVLVSKIYLKKWWDKSLQILSDDLYRINDLNLSNLISEQGDGMVKFELLNNTGRQIDRLDAQVIMKDIAGMSYIDDRIFFPLLLSKTSIPPDSQKHSIDQNFTYKITKKQDAYLNPYNVQIKITHIGKKKSSCPESEY